ERNCIEKARKKALEILRAPKTCLDLLIRKCMGGIVTHKNCDPEDLRNCLINAVTNTTYFCNDPEDDATCSRNQTPRKNRKVFGYAPDRCVVLKSLSRTGQLPTTILGDCFLPGLPCESDWPDANNCQLCPTSKDYIEVVLCRWRNENGQRVMIDFDCSDRT